MDIIATRDPQPHTRDPRRYTPNLVAVMHGVVCPHCHAVHDPKRLRVSHNVGEGQRRHVCTECGKPFISTFSAMPYQKRS